MLLVQMCVSFPRWSLVFPVRPMMHSVMSLLVADAFSFVPVTFLRFEIFGLFFLFVMFRALFIIVSCLLSLLFCLLIILMVGIWCFQIASEWQCKERALSTSGQKIVDHYIKHKKSQYYATPH